MTMTELVTFKNVSFTPKADIVYFYYRYYECKAKAILDKVDEISDSVDKKYIDENALKKSREKADSYLKIAKRVKNEYDKLPVHFFGFAVKESDKSYSSPEWLDRACRKDANIIEVIGNVHMNPELLEEQHED